MTKNADAIWKLADSRRDDFEKHGVGGRLFSFDLIGFIRACKEEGIPIGTDELRFILSRLDMGSLDGPISVPDNVSEFMARLAEPCSPQTILDPWAGVGFLAATVSKQLKPKSFSAYTQNAQERDVFDLLQESSWIEMTLGDPLEALQESESTFDLAIGCRLLECVRRNL